MSFGFGVGDFIAVGKLTIQLYNACADAPSEFQELRRDLSSIHTVLYGLQSQAEDPTSLLRRRCDDRKPEWDCLKENLEETLLELHDLLKRYSKMGRNAWKRVKLGLQNLANLRSKLGIHLNSINTFVGSLALSALGRMEPALGRIEILLLEFVKEERSGNKAPTVLSAHEEVDGPAWKQMKLDLLLGGISMEDLERNEERIRDLLEWVVDNERDLIHLGEIEVGESTSQRQSFEEVVEEPVYSSSRSLTTSGTHSRPSEEAVEEPNLVDVGSIYPKGPPIKSVPKQSADIRTPISIDETYSSKAISLQQPDHGGPAYPNALQKNMKKAPVECQELSPKYLDDFGATRILSKVANRKNPKFKTGKMDISSAFVICDDTFYDCPVIYASKMFEKLTGYSKVGKSDETLGRNCRFLQSPEGKNEKDNDRDFVSANYLMALVADKKEAQQNILNYHKSGKPFMNWLTLVPITGEDVEEIKYYVGFLKGRVGDLEGQMTASSMFHDYSEPGDMARFLGMAFNQPRVKQLLGREKPMSDVDCTAVFNILHAMLGTRNDRNTFSQEIESYLRPYRRVKVVRQNAATGKSETRDSQFSDQIQLAQRHDYPHYHQFNGPNKTPVRTHEETFEMGDRGLEDAIKRTSELKIEENSFQRRTAPTGHEEIPEISARVTSGLENFMTEYFKVKSERHLMLSFCFHEASNGLTVEGMITRLRESRLLGNIALMRLNLLLVNAFKHGWSLNGSASSEHIYLMNLDSLLQAYNEKLLLINEWDVPLPRELKSRIIETRTQIPAQSTRISSGGWQKVDMAIPVRILIIDHGLTHFGLMFEQKIKHISQDITLSNYCGVHHKPQFEVHHFGPSNARKLKGNHMSEFTLYQQKRIGKTKQAFRDNGIDDSNYPNMFFMSTYRPNGHLQPYGYDYIILVPQILGSRSDSDSIMTPWSAEPLRYSILAGFDNYIDVVKYMTIPGAAGTSQFELRLPYRTGLFSSRQNSHFKEADEQVDLCVKEFASKGLWAKDSEW